jgi:hypothetical protein
MCRAIIVQNHAKPRKTGPEPVDFLAFQPLGWYIYSNRHYQHS